MQPSALRLRTRSNVLELDYADQQHFVLPAELLRVYSPSAEVRGHGPGQEVLQTGKRWVKLTQVEPVGHYGVKLHFDDGHDTGIYTWDYLRELGENQAQRWQDYLDRLHAANARREPKDSAVQVLNIRPLRPKESH
ncbi:MAG: DUF971 domain-containing protein [Pseudomonadales bacterium]|jgi:DUF971 family protein|nr:DUF971 domain-containing protein [Pseudomonadales bacterium]